jgi:hypothetical protein
MPISVMAGKLSQYLYSYSIAPRLISQQLHREWSFLNLKWLIYPLNEKPTCSDSKVVGFLVPREPSIPSVALEASLPRDTAYSLRVLGRFAVALLIKVKGHTP